MVFGSEGQHDSSQASQAQSAWRSPSDAGSVSLMIVRLIEPQRYSRRHGASAAVCRTGGKVTRLR
jgi:hypothetical protein